MKTITKCLAAISMLAASMGAQAQHRGSGGYEPSTERVVLRFNDMHLRGPNTLMLKREIRQQNPNINPRDYTIESVKLVAKTKMGHGQAQLQVGEWKSNPQRVYGSPEQFHRRHRGTYDRVHFYGNSYSDSQGLWQILLRGNFKIKKVVLNLKLNRRRRPVHQQQTLVCGSQGFGKGRCYVPGNIVSVMVQRQYSRRACVQGRTFGFYGDELWTQRGCEAQFLVTYRPHNSFDVYDPGRSGKNGRGGSDGRR